MICVNNIPRSCRRVKCVFPRTWPKHGQDWDIKEKGFCIFSRFELLAKSFWCPEQDLNLHSFRNTHLKRARLPIPPPGHLVAFHLSELGGKKKQLMLLLFVPRTRLELAPPYGDYPLKVACLPIPPPGLAISRKRVQKY